MAQDEREQEQEFLADLVARTGRSLSEWMALIAAQGFADKNETIDWLRGEGIPFARASWLERIHSNGGQPIYAQAAARAAPGVPTAPAATAPPPTPRPRPQPKPAPAPAPRALDAQETAQLETLLAAGKGYRPLYHLLEGQVRAAVPGLAVVPKGGYLSLGAPGEFAAVTLTGSELRIALDLGERPFDAHLQKSKMRGPGAAITHMLVLTDARQVNEEFINLVKAANARVNG